MEGIETITDITSKLDDPVEYVRLALGNMASFRRDTKQTPIVRIGTTGRGTFPNYRVEPEGDLSTPEGMFEAYDQFFEHMMAFNGRSHKKMNWDASEIRSEHWSSRFMTFSEVQHLLGELRSKARANR